MSRNVVVPDELYSQLEESARRRGLADIQQLLAAWQATEGKVAQRARAVQQIDSLRDRLFDVYGEMRDSVELLREDRER